MPWSPRLLLSIVTLLTSYHPAASFDIDGMRYLPATQTHLLMLYLLLAQLDGPRERSYNITLSAPEQLRMHLH